MIENLLSGAELVFQPTALLLIIAGVLIGITMGSIPGMTATMTVAILVSFTFGMSPVEGMMLLLGIYGGALYAGSIPAILIRTPGTPSAAATVFDGFPLAEKGQAGRAIGIATIASFFGGLFSVIVLATFSPVIANLANEFHSVEYFALAFFGLTIIAAVSGDSVVRGMIAGLLGIFISLIGIDPQYGLPRYTAGISGLQGGVDLIAMMIGVFGIAEGLRRYKLGIETGAADMKQEVTRLVPSLADIKTILAPSTLSSVIGAFIGAVPGAGGDIASFVTYNEVKRWFKGDVSFGEGNINGVAAAESGNNASTGGALIPTLTLGIPGDTVGAILIGALLVHGIRPGPALFEGETQLVYAIFVGFAVVYFAILVFGLFGAHLWVRILNFPARYIWPAIFVLCAVGAYSMRGGIFEVYIMAIAGVLGYILISQNYPIAPMILGLILGPIAESNLRRALVVSGGDLTPFYTRPLGATILALALLSLTWPMISTRLKRRNIM